MSVSVGCQAFLNLFEFVLSSIFEFVLDIRHFYSKIVVICPVGDLSERSIKALKAGEVQRGRFVNESIDFQGGIFLLL